MRSKFRVLGFVVFPVHHINCHFESTGGLWQYGAPGAAAHFRRHPCSPEHKLLETPALPEEKNKINNNKNPPCSTWTHLVDLKWEPEHVLKLLLQHKTNKQNSAIEKRECVANLWNLQGLIHTRNITITFRGRGGLNITGAHLQSIRHTAFNCAPSPKRQICWPQQIPVWLPPREPVCPATPGRRSIATILIAPLSPGIVAALCVKLTVSLSARFHTVGRGTAEHSTGKHTHAGAHYSLQTRLLYSPNRLINKHL